MNKVRSALLVRTSSVVDKVDHPQFFDPCYHLEYIEAALRKDPDMRVHVHDGWIHPLDVDGLVALAREVRPDLLVVSWSSFDVDVSNEFGARLESAPDAPLIVGLGHGRHLNHDTRDPLDRHYDAILMGEPEFTLAAVSPSELMAVRARMDRRYLFRPDSALRHRWNYAGFYLMNPGIFRIPLGIRKLFRSHEPAERVEELVPRPPPAQPAEQRGEWAREREHTKASA